MTQIEKNAEEFVLEHGDKKQALSKVGKMLWWRCSVAVASYIVVVVVSAALYEFTNWVLFVGFTLLGFLWVAYNTFVVIAGLWVMAKVREVQEKGENPVSSENEQFSDEPLDADVRHS